MITFINEVKTQSMEHSPVGRVILMGAMYLLDAGLWVHSFALWLKVGYSIMAGVVTVLGLINQWNTLSKTKKTWWVVVKVNSFADHISPKARAKRKKKHTFTEKNP